MVDGVGMGWIKTGKLVSYLLAKSICNLHYKLGVVISTTENVTDELRTNERKFLCSL